ncbi:MAG TPA: hypothetical protein PLF26_02370 [Blastocatellia bacterium]|nr:hypothetical protein [Blastocatellia bacterium]
MQQTYTYQATLEASERITWRVEDIIGGEKRLDFTRPFMPESLARVEPLAFLTPYEQRTLNQIRGHAYLTIFGIVEEFILPFVLDHVRTQLADDDYRVRAMLEFAGEEAKHIHLFKLFCEEFDRGFGSPCAVIGPAADIGRAVLAHDPLAVALTILQIEWMTQSHYVDSIKDAGDLDPQFKSLLKHHWMEEAQHAKLDTLMVEALAEGRSEAEILAAVDQYLAIGGIVDGGITQQVNFDMQALMGATRRTLTEDQKQQIRDVQRQANRWTYLGSGMRHEKFLDTLGKLSPAARERIEAVTPAFC